MRALLDTHAFLWWILEDPRLSPRAAEAMAKGGNRLLWSAASSWEVAVKWRLGRIELPGSPGDYLSDQLRRQRIDMLPVHHSHAWAVAELPLHHRDPFDRMLIAQARVEGVPILTADHRFSDYEVEVLW